MRIFLDANILFSAAKSDGAIRRLLEEIRIAGHELWADGYVAEEARRNLTAKNPAATGDFEHLLTPLHVVPEMVAPAMPTLPHELPEKDQPVFATAILHHCQVLLTGDRKHFDGLYGQTVAGVTVVHSPRSLAKLTRPHVFESCPMPRGSENSGSVPAPYSFSASRSARTSALIFS